MRFSKDKSPYKTRLGILFWDLKKMKMTHPGSDSLVHHGS
ncbi:MAG: DUF2461 family protein [Candidatus Poribacteria bacterium]